MTNSKREIIVHQHQHHGWTTETYKASCFDDAARMDILAHHPFLSKFKHKIAFEENRYIVTYEDKTRRMLGGMVQPIQYPGDYWFGDKIREGSSDDCESCGGTGINHYNPFVQCWACGHEKRPGKGTGKIGRQS